MRVTNVPLRIEGRSQPPGREVVCRPPDPKPGCIAYPHTRLCENAPLCVEGTLEVQLLSPGSHRVRVLPRTLLLQFPERCQLFVGPRPPRTAIPVLGHSIFCQLAFLCCPRVVWGCARCPADSLIPRVFTQCLFRPPPHRHAGLASVNQTDCGSTLQGLMQGRGRGPGMPH